MMNLSFEAQHAASYRSACQRIRLLSEHWVGNQVYCPHCGFHGIERYGNNRPVADFFCADCSETFELKSQSKIIGKKIVDGAYRTMMDRLSGNDNPNLILLSYDLSSISVINLLVIPKHFFTPAMIEQRKPLAPAARRAGWIGCNILLEGIPRAGRIFVVKDGIVEPKKSVLAQWRKTLFLREQSNFGARGWLLDVMNCIECLERPIFSLADIYSFESRLKAIYPGNGHIREKVRQQLQVLRDKGYLEFTGKGTYRIVCEPT